MPEAWETFVIEKVGGSGIIGSGQAIALRVSSGHYVVAEDGGGREVNANRPAVGPWETFTITIP